jgi:hypothetical protein
MATWPSTLTSSLKLGMRLAPLWRQVRPPLRRGGELFSARGSTGESLPCRLPQRRRSTIPCDLSSSGGRLFLLSTSLVVNRSRRTHHRTSRC